MNHSPILTSSEPVSREVLAIIPARGGSKSVPRKNVLTVGGKPLIGWTIEHALESSLISRVIVSTDDDEIASVAKEYGAEVPFMRPKELALDNSLDIEFHQHALEWLNLNENYRPEAVANLRPTSPGRNPKTIDAAIKRFFEHPNADSLRSVHLAEQSPFKMWHIGSDGFMTPVVCFEDVTEAFNLPRQSLPLVYWQDGYIDIARFETITKKKSTVGSTVLPFLIDNPIKDIDYFDEIDEVEQQLQTLSLECSTVEVRSRLKRHPS